MRVRVQLLLMALMVCAGALCADDMVMFNYQGRVKVGGQDFNGSGRFKFAILNTSATAALWTNDGTAIPNGEPTADVAVAVSEGVFNVMIGDPSASMQPINSAIFNSRTPLKLRTWFSDGIHGFEQLNPDSNLVNLTLITLNTGSTDFAIYVNGGTGNDANNGLTPQTAKKTIQAAVDTLPSRLNCNVTIDIANGVYREEVKIYGFDIIPGKSLTVLGDETWTSTTVAEPAVRITGCDNDGTSVPVRTYCMFASACSGVTIQGILFDHAADCGLRMQNGVFTVRNCKFRNNVKNGALCHKTEVEFDSCISSYNQQGHGFALGSNSFGTLRACTGTYNGYAGVSLNTLTSANILGPGVYSNNTIAGMHVILKSCAQFVAGAGGRIQNNTACVAEIWGDSFAINMNAGNTITGNGYGNAAATSTGGVLYY